MIVAALCGCGKGSGSDSAGNSKAPEGQVVAKIGDDEITVRELRMEMQGVSMSTPEALKNAERQALDGIITRKLLANEARRQGLDDRPEFQLVRQRVEATLLAQMLQREIASKVGKPTREEAERYLASNPHSFAQRKVFIVDQVQFPSSIKPEAMRELSAMKSLQDIEQYLLANGIEYRRVPGSVDSRGAPRQMIEQIVRLPANSVFIIPSGQMFFANQIKETRLVPFVGEQAVEQAQQILMNERIGEELRKRVAMLRKSAGNPQYKAGFGPPAPAPAAGSLSRQPKPATAAGADTPPG